ncbi:MAG: hypothetical protein U0992_02560 [Planctomycetaceae bacterium]
MVVRPGVNLIRLAAVIAAVSVLGLWIPVTATVLVLLLSLTAVTLCVADYRELRRRLQMVSIQRRHPPVVGRDLPFDVEWTIQSRRAVAGGNVS